jgi:hypothetical protein
LRRSMGLDQKRRIGGPRLQTNDVPCHT